MLQFFAVFFQKTLNGALIHFIEIGYHFLSETIFPFKKHPGKTKVLLKNFHGVAIVQHILSLDI